MTRVAFLSCHLSGTGHLVRVLALARALDAAGGQALVLSGGRALDHLDTAGVGLVQLPPLSVPDLDFANPRGPDGAPADAALMGARVAAIAATIRDFAPDALVTETFPLGRRRLAAEFEAAIAAAGPRAAILASVRDVPEPPKRPGRVEEAARRLAADYDALIVHGDAGFLPLSASWPLPDRLAPRIHHTGYVGHGARMGASRGDWVLVSGGGGALGRELLEIAARAACLSPRLWRLITGGTDAAEHAADLSRRYGGVGIHTPRGDFRRLLAGAGCSVSLCGYNTVMDLAACATPAILVPFEDRGEREQRIRADRLAGCPGIAVLDAATLTPEQLAEAVEAAATAPLRPRLTIATDGAARAAALILETVRTRNG